MSAILKFCFPPTKTGLHHENHTHHVKEGAEQGDQQKVSRQELTELFKDCLRLSDEIAMRA